MQAVRFVYFDLDDTLLDHRHAEHTALADVYAAHPFARHTLDEVRALYREINLDVWHRYAHGQLTKDEAKLSRFARLLDACGVTGVDAGAVSALYFEHYQRHWQWCDGAEQAFFAVAARFPVGVVTNGFAAIQRAKLARFPALRDRLAALVISEEVGHMKPALALFDHATKLAGVDREHILYIGDSLSSDVRGGRAAGWHVAWYRPGATTSAATGATTSAATGAAPSAATGAESNPEPDAFQFDRWPALTAHLSL